VRLPASWAALWRLTRRLAPWLAGIAVYCVIVGLVIDRFTLSPLAWEAEATVANALILGVLLGFRNRVAYERWWEARQLWGQLINETRNLAWKARSYLPAETVTHMRIAPVLIGFAEALKRHLRGSTRLQEIPGFEKDSANPAHVPLYLAGKVLTGLATCQREGQIDGTTALVLDVHARALLDICGACERIRSTTLAFSYKALLWLGIALNILIAPWYTLAVLGILGIPVLLIICFFLLGIEHIDAAIEDPFGTDPDDLDLDTYCNTIRLSVVAILDNEPPGLSRRG
jgi:putative membrane protein